MQGLSVPAMQILDAVDLSWIKKKKRDQSGSEKAHVQKDNDMMEAAVPQDLQTS